TRFSRDWSSDVCSSDLVHGVHRHEARTLDLIEHPPLKLRVDVAEEDVLRAPVGLGQLGREVLEDVELGVERLRLVELVAVAPLPAEGLAGLAGQPLQVDVPALEEV